MPHVLSHLKTSTAALGSILIRGTGGFNKGDCKCWHFLSHKTINHIQTIQQRINNIMYYNATVADTAAVGMLLVDLDSSILSPIKQCTCK